MPMDMPPDVEPIALTKDEEGYYVVEVCSTLTEVSSLEDIEDLEELWFQLQKEIIETGDVPESTLEKFKSLSADSETD